MKILYLFALPLFLLIGCASPQQDTHVDAAYQLHLDRLEAVRLAQRVPVAHVSMGCYVHGNSGYVHGYAVEEPIWGQFSRGMVSSFSCGGIVGGGYPVPRTWTPGMKVKVRWNRPIKGEDHWIEKTTAILPYTEVGDLFTHFFPNDEVRVVVANPGPMSSKHPILHDAVVPPPEPE